MNAETVEIIAGGSPERHFARLGLEPRKTADVLRHGERFTVWELSPSEYKRLSLEDGEAAEDLWVESGSWWRLCRGSTFAAPGAEITISGRTLVCWENEAVREQLEDDGEEHDPLQWEDWPDVFAYLCDHMGISTEGNLAAVLPDLARANGMSVGELLTATSTQPQEATEDG